MAFPSTRTIASGFYPGQMIEGMGHEYFDDFHTGGYGTTTGPKFASTANVAEWLYTVNTGTPTFIISDAEPGGVLAASAGAATDNHGWDAQLNGEAFTVAAGKDIYFETRWKSRTSVTDIDWLIGLCNTGTEIIAGTVANAIVFRSGAVDAAPLNAGTADIIASTGDDITSWTHANISEVDTGINLVADTFVTLAFWLRVNSEADKRLTFYVNGAEKFNTTTNIPDIGTALTPSFSGQNNGSTNEFVMEIDYIYCGQAR